jgi:phosphatidylinositol alpha-mannosyltransferase
MGVDARVLGPCDGPPPHPAVTPLGNSMPTSSNGSMAAIAPDVSAQFRTIRALRDEAFDVVHLHEPLAPGPTITALVLSEKPLVGTFHRAGESGWVRTFRWLGVWAVKHLTIRAAVSEEARDTAMKLGGTYELLWNGIDVDLYQDAEAWPVDGPTVMFVGRHEPRKGLDVLLEAMKQLDDDVRLWVASEGPETERLRRMTAEDPRIEWLGMIDDAEKIRRIRGADVLCAPSLHGESFGVVLLEGMAAGTPVVASDLPGYRVVAQAGRDALLPPPGDSAGLVKSLETALAGGPAIEDMVDQGLERAKTFSLHRLAERYVELYEKAIGQ